MMYTYWIRSCNENSNTTENHIEELAYSILVFFDRVHFRCSICFSKEFVLTLYIQGGAFHLPDNLYSIFSLLKVVIYFSMNTY